MLTLQNPESIRRIEASIGYTFRDKRLLVQVFTRKTYMRVDPEAPDNEVLEFYGDMLMSYHVTTYFIEKFAHMLDDGLYFMRTVEQFTEMRSHYVRNQYLTERIKQLIPNIDRLVRAQNPRTELPKDNQKAYADLFESLVGAVYLDSYRDDDLIRAFILRHLNIEPKATEETVRRSSRTVVLPAVSLVDKTADTPRGDIPERETDISPAAEPDSGKPSAAPAEALAEAVTATSEEPADATAVTDGAPVLSHAAPDILHIAPCEPEAAAEIPATEQEIATPHRDELIAFCRDAGYEPPLFGETPKNAPNARPVAACTVRFRNKRGKPVKICLNDSGRTMAEATEKVALKMLKKLREQQAAEAAPAPKKNTESVAPAEAVPAVDVPVAVTPAETPAETPTEASVEATPIAEVTAETAAETAAETPTESVPTESAPTESAPTAEVPATETTAVETTAVEATDSSSEAAAVPETTAPVQTKNTSRRGRTRKQTGTAPAEETANAAEAVAQPVVEPTVETPAKKKAPTRKSRTPKASAPAAPSDKVDTAAAAPAKPRRKTPSRAKKNPPAGGDNPAENAE